MHNLRADVLAWQATLDSPRLPTQGKDASSRERALAVRFSKVRSAAQAGGLSADDKAALASIHGAESLFATLSPMQQLAEDIKSWQTKTGLQRFPNRANSAN